MVVAAVDNGKHLTKGHRVIISREEWSFAQNVSSGHASVVSQVVVYVEMF